MLRRPEIIPCVCFVSKTPKIFSGAGRVCVSVCSGVGGRGGGALISNPFSLAGGLSSAT